MAFASFKALRPVLFGSVAALSLNAAAAGQETPTATLISLQEQPLSDALRSVAQKTGESILFTPESVEGLRAPAISGQMSAQQAVSMLTRGTDLEVLADGNLQLDGTAVSEEQLTAKLAAARTPLTEPTVVIHGDAKCPFQNVAAALGACRQAGISELGITVRIASAGATKR